VVAPPPRISPSTTPIVTEPSVVPASPAVNPETPAAKPESAVVPSKTQAMDTPPPPTPVGTPKAGPPPPVMPTSPAAPAKPAAAAPVSPVKPVAPGAVLPVRPVTPGAAVPPAPGVAPLKPATATPVAPPPEPNAKTGTAVVKSAPPKETARITVKPNLPAAPARPANVPSAAPSPVPAAALAVGAAAGAVAAPKSGAKGGKPATTIVKTGTTKAATPTVKKAPLALGGPSAPAASAVAYEEEPPTTWTTVPACILFLLTWATAGVLFASLEGWM
jgi:hypothetical protein